MTTKAEVKVLTDRIAELESENHVLRKEFPYDPFRQIWTMKPILELIGTNHETFRVKWKKILLDAGAIGMLPSATHHQRVWVGIPYFIALAIREYYKEIRKIEGDSCNGIRRIHAAKLARLRSAKTGRR